MMFHYSLYGLRVAFNEPVPELVEASGIRDPDVEVWLQSVPDRLEELLGICQEHYPRSFEDGKEYSPNLIVRKLAGGRYIWLRYSDDTVFVVDNAGRRIWCKWPATLRFEDALVYLLGPVLGFVLRLRGTISLHASAVNIGNTAVAIAGPAGAGKSTTAAAFAELGYPVLSDDVVALSDQSTGFWVQPGYPRLRLWPGSVKILYGSPDLLPKLVPGQASWDKRYLSLTDKKYNFQRRALRLSAIYLLEDRCDDGAAPFIETVTGSAGLMRLVANTSANKLLDKRMRGLEFHLLNRIVEETPIRRLTPHADPRHLLRLCHIILDDFVNRSNAVSLDSATMSMAPQL